jgi:hypothetical protein
MERVRLVKGNDDDDDDECTIMKHNLVLIHSTKKFHV